MEPLKRNQDIPTAEEWGLTSPLAELWESHAPANVHQSVIENALGLIREIPDPMNQLKTLEHLEQSLEFERNRIISRL